MERVQCCVIGAGVVGLAVARSLALSGLEVIILEKASQIGTGISSRNSEVIHAGIYYQQGSLKAKMCVEGKNMLYEYCESQYVNHRRIGKLIVATNETEVLKLKSIKDKALHNGVDDLVLMDQSQILKIEPNIKAEAALFSPSTGIIDSHGLMSSLLRDAEELGATLALNTHVQKGVNKEDGWIVQTYIKNENSITGSDTEKFKLQCDTVINCAGLSSSNIALALGCPPIHVPTTRFAKGNYFSLLNCPNPFNHLVYPIPSEHGLGVHATLDLGNQVRFGPDVEWVDDADDFVVDPKRGEAFSNAIKSYWPDLPEDSLVPAYSGIRPKIHQGDFVIQDSQVHGMKGLINLFGIESPGLTSSMAIAKAVTDRLL